MSRGNQTKMTILCIWFKIANKDWVVLQMYFVSSNMEIIWCK